MSTISTGLKVLEKASRIIAFSLLSFLPVVYAADDGDDFSNNLFSDLAPLMALFGEQVTKQFLSQSMGWADDILISMAPLGILTVMISAIRISGHQWLKNIIGRARESDGLAEAELMSSTSSDVCELWGRSGVVRVLGSPDLAELIYRADSNGICVDGSIYNLHGAVESSLLVEKTPRTKKPTSSKEAPNLVLNVCGAGVGQMELWFYAGLGIVLQLAVLIWCFMAVEIIRYLKGGKEVKYYALPATITGTVLVCAGVLICSYVVEASTSEHIYEKPEAREGLLHARREISPENAKAYTRTVFLQRGGQMVNDQRFEGYAIFDDPEQAEIKTSRKNNKDLRQRVLLGTFLTLCGFLLQFIGLRAMHWSCTIAQLVATLIMTAVRAFARRGLSSETQAIQISEGMELQWLAKHLTGCEQWSVETGFVDFREKIAPGSGPGSNTPSSYITMDTLINWMARPEDKTAIKDVVPLLQQLYSLTNWERPSQQLAISTGRAIEKIMNTIYNNKEGVTIVREKVDLPIISCLVPIFTDNGASYTDFGLNRTRKTGGGDWGQWFADTDRIEAILSLWMVSQHEAEQDLEIATIAVREYRSTYTRAIQRSNTARPGQLSEKMPEETLEPPAMDPEKYLGPARTRVAASIHEEKFTINRCKRQKKFYNAMLDTKDYSPTEGPEKRPSDRGGFVQVLGAWDPTQEKDYETWLEIRKHGDLSQVVRKGAIIHSSIQSDVIKFPKKHQNPTRTDLRHRYFGFEFHNLTEEAEAEDESGDEPESEKCGVEELEIEMVVFKTAEQEGQERDWSKREQQKMRLFLLSETDTPANDMLGLDLVSKFMWTVVKNIEAIHGVTRPRMVNLKDDEKALINSVLDDLAQSIVEAGLGDLQDAYNVLIPPLSAAGKLPKVPDVVPPPTNPPNPPNPTRKRPAPVRARSSFTRSRIMKRSTAAGGGSSAGAVGLAATA